MTRLVLEDCGLVGFNQALRTLTALEVLEVASCDLFSVPVEVSALSRLRELHLARVPVENFPPNVLKALVQLTKLTLEELPLQEVPDEIGQLSQLRELVIECSGEGTQVSSGLFELTNLTKLHLMGELTFQFENGHFPVGIGKLCRLKDFLLAMPGRARSITHFPDSFYQGLGQLQMWELDYTGFATIPPIVSGLTSLQLLRMLGESVTTLPDELFRLPRLTSLFISEPADSLECIPPSIGYTTGLVELAIDGHDQITTLPDAIGQLKALTTLDICNNKLETLPECVYELPSLKCLHIRGNPIMALSPAIATMPRLKRVDVNYDRTTFKIIRKLPRRSLHLPVRPDSEI